MSRGEEAQGAVLVGRPVQHPGVSGSLCASITQQYVRWTVDTLAKTDPGFPKMTRYVAMCDVHFSDVNYFHKVSCFCCVRPVKSRATSLLKCILPASIFYIPALVSAKWVSFPCL